MAEVKKLAKFTIKPAGRDFTFHIEDDGGQTLELTATRDQVDVIADELDDFLSQDDSADEVGGTRVNGDEEEIEGDEENKGEKPLLRGRKAEAGR